MDPHFSVLALTMLMPAVISETSCIDLRPQRLFSACSLVQSCAITVTHPQPPERLDLTVSANDVMLWLSESHDPGTAGARSLYGGHCMVYHGMKRPTPSQAPTPIARWLEILIGCRLSPSPYFSLARTGVFCPTKSSLLRSLLHRV